MDQPNLKINEVEPRIVQGAKFYIKISDEEVLEDLSIFEADRKAESGFSGTLLGVTSNPEPAQTTT